MSRHNRRAGELAPGDMEALERELRAKQDPPNRQQQRAVERTAQRAEASGFARVTGRHARSRPTGDAA